MVQGPQVFLALVDGFNYPWCPSNVKKQFEPLENAGEVVSWLCNEGWEDCASGLGGLLKFCSSISSCVFMLPVL